MNPRRQDRVQPTREAFVLIVISAVWGMYNVRTLWEVGSLPPSDARDVICTSAAAAIARSVVVILTASAILLIVRRLP